MVVGYDENGHCPMLVAGRCSVYEHRPLTCRTYDCRVFAAAGIAADKDVITRRARRWTFSYETQDDRDRHCSVRAAARFLRERAESFPGGAVPHDPAQVAVLAIKVCDVFYGRDRPGAAGDPASEARIAAAVMAENAEVRGARDAATALERGASSPPPSLARLRWLALRRIQLRAPLHVFGHLFRQEDLDQVFLAARL